MLQKKNQVLFCFVEIFRIFDFKQTKPSIILPKFYLNTTKKTALTNGFFNGTCVYLYCRAVSSQILSAFMVLTAVFGMGTGVTP